MKKYVLALSIVIFLVSCKKDVSLEKNSESSAINNASAQKNKHLQIGDTYAGGVIFYFSDRAHKHGLVCAQQDAGSFPWDLTVFDPNLANLYNPVLVGTANTVIGAGSANTSTIVNTLGTGNYAAALSRSYNGGGYNDWFLPSKDELNLMYQNLKVPGFVTFSSSSPSYYWSSSEIDYRAVWSQKFDDGQQVDFAWKNNLMNVRAVRAF